MTRPCTDHSKEAVDMHEAIATVAEHIRLNKYAVVSLKATMWALGLVLWFAFFCSGLYAGTWMVVLALRHAKVIQ